MIRQILPRRKANKVENWMLWRWMVIGRADQPYLLRLYVLNVPWFGVKLHWFAGPDPDPHCHDHPWWFVSWVLRGRYKERRLTTASRSGYTGKKQWKVEESEAFRERWSWAKREATDIHSITWIAPGTITLVINGPYTRTWGFWVGHNLLQFVGWREYLGLDQKQEEV